MSVSYTAYTIIGIEIFPENFIVEKKKPGCVHKHHTDFCSQCGAPKWIGKDKYIDGFNEYSFHGAPFQGKWEMVISTDGERCFIGWVMEADDYHGAVIMKGIPDIDRIKTELMETLEPFGQWDEKLFGVWTVLYCSY